MNQQELELHKHKKLQPLYKRVMGEWQGGDKVITPDRGIHYITKGEVKAQKVFPALSDAYDDCLRIPRTIDSEHPERGFVGNGKGI